LLVAVAVALMETISPEVVVQVVIGQALEHQAAEPVRNRPYL
jgi:hypothetical protein